ncbi:tetraacyldisaccharide 4'-kinase [Acidithiobacillus sp. M4-SHS-6]|uniref:tetraacyldisaccharide 4'-kinase n=1 Tax=Acidithiobacillus sp. M4-SHS-6 TaxID=3383024 RepID=UPI0039BE7E8A
MTLRQTLEAQWQQGGWLATSLRPLGALTESVAAWRRRYIHGRPAAIPSIVVGNLSVGGSGKTPLVAALAGLLNAAGWRVAIISRGYGAQPPHWPYRVNASDSPEQAGDEPLLLVQHQVPGQVAGSQAVFICPDRHQAIAAAAAEGFDLALLDDGFQHLALRPTLRLLVMSGTQPLGNGYCLPAGPLRESPAALAEADALLLDAAAAAGLALGETPPRFHFRVQPRDLQALADPQRTRSLESLAGEHWTAVTGIARPQRFVDTLQALGAEVDARFFPDHHVFAPRDLESLPRPLVMTEKDAVKCRNFAHSDEWVLRIEAQLAADFMPWLERALSTWRDHEH